MNKTLRQRFDELDQAIAEGMYRYGRVLLRYSLAVVFVWFGALKIADISPAADLVRNTVYFFPPDQFLPVLGWWEVLIGVGLAFRPLVRAALFLLALQMPGTFLPLVILPQVCFTSFPFGLTLEGQYIVKNLILISAAFVVGSTVRVVPRHGVRL